MSKSQTKKLNQKLLLQAERLLKDWLPAGRRVRDEWVLGSLANEPGNSLKINMKTGMWADFAENQKGGDLISLYAAREKIPYTVAAERLAQSYVEAAITPVPDNAASPSLRRGQQHPFHVGYSVSQWWAYRNVKGELFGYIVRFDSPNGKKLIHPYSYFASKRWLWKGLGVSYPIYGAELLASRADAQVLLVEGEKTADAARLVFPQFVVATWQGGVGKILKCDWTPLKGRGVIYWPDADDPGRKSVSQIVDCLARAGVSRLQIVTPPSSLPSGWDLADKTPSSVNLYNLIASAVDADLNSVNAFLALDEEGLIDRLIFVAQTMQFFDIVTGRRFDEAQLKSLFLNHGPSVPKRLLASPRLRKVIAYTYRPGLEERIFDDGKGAALLNLWVNPGIDYVEGDATPFIEHLRFLCATEDEFNHLSDMLAFIVQKPGEKLKSGIVLIGKQGTGKSFVGVALSKILGVENTAMVTSSEIRSDFNDWIEAKQLIVVEEVMTLGRREVMNRLKPLITETTIRVNTKHQRAYSLENAANFIFLSNYEDALKLETGDRRYFVVASDKDPKDAAYYKALWTWMQQNIGVIAHWLSSRDLSGFDENARPPETEGKNRMIEAGRDEHEALIAELIECGAFPFEQDLIEVSVVREKFSAMPNGHRFSQPQLQKALRAVGAERLGQMKGIANGKEVRVSLWAVRNVAKYRSMSPHAIVEEYARAYGLYNSEERKRLIG
jgi:hypothetical protein